MAQKTKLHFSWGGFFGVGFLVVFLGGYTQKKHRVFLGMYPGLWTLLNRQKIDIRAVRYISRTSSIDLSRACASGSTTATAPVFRGIFDNEALTTTQHNVSKSHTDVEYIIFYIFYVSPNKRWRTSFLSSNISFIWNFSSLALSPLKFIKYIL